MNPPQLRAFTSASLLPTATVFLAIAIFIADTITNSEIAIPAFYPAVVLLSVRYSKRRGVLLVGLGCIALTLFSDALTAQTKPTEAGVINTAISITSIMAVTYLALRIESAKAAAFEVRAQLAHVARVTTLGELTASIAHEVNQPLAAVVINGNACMRWLAVDPPNLDEARRAVDRIVKDANRASEVIARVRLLTKSSPPQMDTLGINDIIIEGIKLTESEMQQNQISLQTRLSDRLPSVLGDRVQLQQVVLNLILNAIEGMRKMPNDGREIVVSSAFDQSDAVIISVCDSGPGVKPDTLDRLFDAFYTTKPEGMGMGLAISRSIVEAHGGRISATPHSPRGMVFEFTLPIAGARS
jgi:signal transduction histidine kinase